MPNTLDLANCISDPHITFFMYHYIRDDDSHDNRSTHALSVPPGIFREHMETVQQLSKNGTVTLMHGDDFLNSFRKNCYPGKNIWIFTTDDGWSDTATYLAPTAKSYAVPFFFGIIENRIGQPGFMNSGEVVHIAQDPLFTISSHSMTHENQDTMSPEKEKDEICQSKKLLE
jgi:poly-beta-1,6-N-acetyl-D-glucosamine N-deacetylase